jgi:hypothetical protein
MKLRPIQKCSMQNNNWSSIRESNLKFTRKGRGSEASAFSSVCLFPMLPPVTTALALERVVTQT